MGFFQVQVWLFCCHLLEQTFERHLWLKGRNYDTKPMFFKKRHNSEKEASFPLPLRPEKLSSTTSIMHLNLKLESISIFQLQPGVRTRGQTTPYVVNNKFMFDSERGEIKVLSAPISQLNPGPYCY